MADDADNITKLARVIGVMAGGKCQQKQRQSPMTPA
jgi:hypothetical protein